MRTIHADLKTAQEAVTEQTPYVYIYINSTDYSSRLISLEHVEEPYRDRATIILDNHDRALDPGTVDLRGKEFSIGYGYNTASGNKYTGDGAGTDGSPTLWVKSQCALSKEGKAVCVLECEGCWMKLRELRYLAVGDAPYYEYQYGGTQTIKDLIVLALTEATMTLHATYGDDSIVHTLKPYFTVNSPPFESLAALIHRLIQMTKCYLRPLASKVFKVIYPQETDSINESYYSDEAPYFKEYTEKRNLLVPNDIKVFWGANDDETWNAADIALPGSAVDADAITAYARVRHCFIAPDLRSQADANNRAAAVLQRYKAETLAGRLLLPYHDCSVELYDRVCVYDDRGL